MIRQGWRGAAPVPEAAQPKLSPGTTRLPSMGVPATRQWRSHAPERSRHLPKPPDIGARYILGVQPRLDLTFSASPLSTTSGALRPSIRSLIRALVAGPSPAASSSPAHATSIAMIHPPLSFGIRCTSPISPAGLRDDQPPKRVLGAWQFLKSLPLEPRGGHLQYPPQHGRIRTTQ